MYRNSDLRKAIAFSLFVKAHSRNSIIKNWNINKLHDITGVSVNAIKARLATLRSMGLIEETGVDNKHLVFKSLHSHTAHRNVVLPSVEFKPDVNLKKNAYAQEIKNLENVLVAMLLVEIQRRKDFAWSTGNCNKERTIIWQTKTTNLIFFWCSRRAIPYRLLYQRKQYPRYTQTLTAKQWIL